MPQFYFKSTKKAYDIDVSTFVFKRWIIKEIYNFNRSTIYLYPDQLNTLVSMKYNKDGKDKVKVSLTHLGFGKWINPNKQMVNIQDNSETIDHENGQDISGDVTTEDVSKLKDELDDVDIQDNSETKGVDLLALYKQLQSEGKNYQEIMKALETNPVGMKNLKTKSNNE
jgi:hypothetical protein